MAAMAAAAVAAMAAAVGIGTDDQALRGESSAAGEHRVGYISPPVFFFQQQESAEGTGARTWVGDRVEL